MNTDKTIKTETTRAAEGELRKKVEAALAQIRPYLQGDGGDVELVEINGPEKTVKVRLLGGCACCPSASMTLKDGVEAAIKKNAPEIRTVLSV